MNASLWIQPFRADRVMGRGRAAWPPGRVRMPIIAHLLFFEGFERMNEEWI